MAYEPTEWARGTKITAQKLNNIERGVESVNSEYTPTTWAEGDIVTATKLNNIEQGIANAGGGGGDSDFSTAEVTITNNYEGNISIVGWTILPEEEGNELQHEISVNANEEKTANVVFYKNASNNPRIVDFHELSIQVALTGDIEDDGDGYLIVSGPGTITIDNIS